MGKYNTCDYEHPDYKWDEGLVPRCGLAKDHPGLHEFVITWDTDPEDIPHNCSWIESTGSHTYLTFSFLPNPSKVWKCSFCGKIKNEYSPEDQKIVDDHNKFMMSTLIPRLDPLGGIDKYYVWSKDDIRV